jgi:hypothetical protein
MWMFRRSSAQLGPVPKYPQFRPVAPSVSIPTVVGLTGGARYPAAGKRASCVESVRDATSTYS